MGTPGRIEATGARKVNRMSTVVTGSTRGIGFGLVRALLLRGCDVVLCGRSPGGVDAGKNCRVSPAESGVRPRTGRRPLGLSR